jgi:hypothetical protein
MAGLQCCSLWTSRGSWTWRGGSRIRRSTAGKGGDSSRRGASTVRSSADCTSARGSFAAALQERGSRATTSASSPIRSRASGLPMT